MRVRLKALFEPLVTVVNEHSNTKDEVNGTAVWAVLSALRGPDLGWEPSNVRAPDGRQYDWDEIKSATTGVIRHTIGLTLKSGRFAVNPDHETYATVRRMLANRGVYGHFVMHAMLAFEALGLTWEQVNA